MKMKTFKAISTVSLNNTTQWLVTGLLVLPLLTISPLLMAEEKEKDVKTIEVDKTNTKEKNIRTIPEQSSKPKNENPDGKNDKDTDKGTDKDKN